MIFEVILNEKFYVDVDEILSGYRAWSRGKDLTTINTFIKTKNDLNIVRDFYKFEFKIYQ